VDGPTSATKTDYITVSREYLSYFGSSTVADNEDATSYINLNKLIEVIQEVSPGDTYFDSTDEIGQVYVYYTHQDGRKTKE
jgi:hypothetical protein